MFVLLIPCLLFSQVCELDIIFNFEKAYFMLDELLLAGEVQETSKKSVLKAIAAQDLLQEVRQIYCFVNMRKVLDKKNRWKIVFTHENQRDSLAITIDWL